MAKPTAANKGVPDKVIGIVNEYVREATEARKDRVRQNRKNWQMYLSQQDWSHKTEDQSTEFLPKVAEAGEQMAAFIKRGLVGQGDWFTVKTAENSPIDGTAVRAVLMHFLERVNISINEQRQFSTIISDAVKTGCFESVIALKVHGCFVQENYFDTAEEPATGTTTEEPRLSQRDVWKLRVDVVPVDELLLDPSGLNLYKIHHVERDLYEIQAKAEAGYYDKAVVKQIAEDMSRTDADKPRPREKNQNEATKPQFRKKVVLDEFWGTLLNEDGSVMHEHVYCVIANGKYVIKEPSPYPFWHGEDPFVIAPIIRVPGSVWHKALYDSAVNLNMAMNELYNLMLDGAMAAVWGIRQLHADWLDDPGQVSDGIPPGTTLVLAPGTPPDAKALEGVFTTTVPPEALQLFALTDKEFQATAMTNDMRMGQLSGRSVKATEVMQASQHADATLDAIIGDIENEIIEKVLRKIWLTLLQNVDDMAAEDVVGAVGLEAAFQLSRMTPAQRFEQLAGNKFSVSGLSATLAKAGDFQKMMALMQIVQSNPIMMQSFFQKYHPDKVIDAFLKFLNINPTSISQGPEDQAAMQQRLQQLPQFAQLLGQAQGNGGSQPGIGGNGGAFGASASLNGEIHQNAEPTGGF